MDKKLVIRIIVSIIGLVAAPTVALLMYNNSQSSNLLNYLFISYFSFAVLGILVIKFLKAEKEFIKPKLPQTYAKLQGNFNQNKNTKFSLILILSTIAYLLIFSIPGIPIKNILKITSTFPILFLSFSVLIFVFVCMANWNKSLRKKVNHYLSGGEDDEQIAYAKAEELLYTLNALLVFIAVIIGVASLTYLGF